VKTPNHNRAAPEGAVLSQSFTATASPSDLPHLGIVANPDVEVNIHVLAQDAVAPDDGPFSHLGLAPD
jgi:hypothetical protein